MTAIRDACRLSKYSKTLAEFRTGKTFPVHQTPSFPLLERGMKGVLSFLHEDAL